jgi:chlorobactene glucosyltransferase
LNWALIGLYALLALGTVDLAAWAALLYRLEAGFRGAPRLVGPCGPRKPVVTAVVAARNEEATIGECVERLLAEDCVDDVLVVDDGSEDATYDEALKHKRDERLKVLRLPQGRGKAEACHIGASSANSEWLLFVDADTHLERGAVACALGFAEQRGLDAVSLIGRLRCPNTWDKVATPFLFGLLNSFIRLDSVCDPNSGSAYFYGSFILIRRHSYFGIGGHDAVKHDIVEDRALGRLAKQRGLRICIAQAPSLLSAEWAPGFRNSLRAMERVATPSIDGRIGLGIAFSFALTAMFFVPFILLAVGALTFDTHGYGVSPEFSLGLGAASILVGLALSGRSALRLDSNPLHCVLYPITEFVFTYALWSSVYKALSGKPVVWRGRKYVYGPHGPRNS